MRQIYAGILEGGLGQMDEILKPHPSSCLPFTLSYPATIVLAIKGAYLEKYLATV